MEPTYALETSGLSHHFSGGQAILNDICLQVPSGAIFGFLGPNGAGKTTTLRLILGLLKRQSGVIRIFGETFDRNRIGILQKTGAMIESPSLYGHLSATDNLRILQKIYRCRESRIAEVLQLVGLEGTNNKKAAAFSLGMKQRLGIAMALLHEPDLLILDEPTNGLDPNGMIEIREVLLDLNRQHGITILISSHLLAEIEKMVSHVGIIHHGKLLFQGTLGHLQQERTADTHFTIVTGNNEKAAVLLEEHYGITTQRLPGQLRLPMQSQEIVGRIVKDFVQHGIEIYELSPAQNDLEAIFMKMIHS
jgi:ABC-2 type transport system ATP-binding protein